MKDDLISKQAAIDAVAKILSDREGGNVTWWKPVAESVINVLPSAQPETHEERTETHACDLISRQAAIDAIESAFDRETILNRFVRKIAISAVRKLPSAQPEIIRCRDCKCWRELPNGCQGFCDMHSTYPTLTDFCSWAERREVSE